MPVKTIRLLVILLLMSAASVSLTTQGAGEEIPLHKTPIVQRIDLEVDGSIAAVVLNVTGFPSGSFIANIVWTLEWVDNSVQFDEWANASELTNGIVVRSGERNLTADEPIKSNHEFSYAAYDLRIDSDDRNPKGNNLHVRWALINLLPPWGLQWRENNSLQFIIQDDLTGIIDEFFVFVEGFSLSTGGTEADEAPDLSFQSFLDEQLGILVNIAPWLMLIALAAGFLIYFRKKIF